MKSSTGSDSTNRRSFIIKFLFLVTGIISIIISIPVIGAFFAPLLRKKVVVWRDVGKVEDFTIGDTVLVTFPNASSFPWMGEVSKTASWLRRISEKEFLALSVNCTHLGCPVHWLPDAKIFLCPCHGGVYYADGTYAAGPPPKNLPDYPVRIVGNSVQIMASPVPITTF
ncbi:MAG: ubiquinol-cytochrome c reductase iron-sulfur subunit [Bacteroidales bacterium]